MTFLLLGEKGRQPNLASQVLGAAVRVLAAHWRQEFGYEPVLAETFVVIEQFEDVCYKASGWETVGMSQGYARHRADDRCIGFAFIPTPVVPQKPQVQDRCVPLVVQPADGSPPNHTLLASNHAQTLSSKRTSFLRPSEINHLRSTKT